MWAAGSAARYCAARLVVGAVEVGCCAEVAADWYWHRGVRSCDVQTAAVALSQHSALQTEDLSRPQDSLATTANFNKSLTESGAAMARWGQSSVLVPLMHTSTTSLSGTSI